MEAIITMLHYIETMTVVQNMNLRYKLSNAGKVLYSKYYKDNEISLFVAPLFALYFLGVQ